MRFSTSHFEFVICVIGGICGLLLGRRLAGLKAQRGEAFR